MQDIKLYNIKQLSEILQTTAQTIRNYLRNGRLKGQKIGGKWLVAEKDLKAFLKPKGE